MGIFPISFYLKNEVTMKKAFLLGLIIFTIGCSKEEKKILRIYEPEVFVIEAEGDSTEVILEAKVEGFKIINEDSKYHYDFDYYCDLITPTEEKLVKVASNNFKVSQEDKVDSYLLVDISFLLGSDSPEGSYKAICYIKDNITGEVASITKAFELE